MHLLSPIGTPILSSIRSFLYSSFPRRQMSIHPRMSPRRRASTFLSSNLQSPVSINRLGNCIHTGSSTGINPHYSITRYSSLYTATPSCHDSSPRICNHNNGYPPRFPFNQGKFSTSNYNTSSFECACFCAEDGGSCCYRC
jgi:hypothetical protein